MADHELRALERATAADPEDDAKRLEWAREHLRVHGSVKVEHQDARTKTLRAYSVRCALVERGRAAEAGLWVGDLLEGTRQPGLAVERRKPSDPPHRVRIICQGEDERVHGNYGEPLVLPEPGPITTGRIWLQLVADRGRPFRMNTVSKGVGVLVQPMDPRLYRVAAHPWVRHPWTAVDGTRPTSTAIGEYERRSKTRQKWGPRVAEYLMRTWCVGADERETKAYLKAHAPRNPSWGWRAFWLEARDQTNGWGRGIEDPMKRPKKPDAELREYVALSEPDPQQDLFACK